jgi:hypothetical protein
MRQTVLIRRPLPVIACPICGDMLAARPGSIVKARNWLECLRRCTKCGVGISNAQSTPTIIFNDSRLNVPEEVRDGVLDTLALAFNKRNRANKRTKFGFSTSEDALTWTLFKFLSDSGQLTRVLRRAGLQISDQALHHEALLLWGVPIPMDRDAGWAIRGCLKSISDQLGEDPARRTEPDVLIDFGVHGLFIIEVKHRSRTVVQGIEHARWDRYFPANSPLSYTAAMRSSGCYELARNWKFGLELAAKTDRPFTLACLGPDSLFRGEDEKVLQAFEGCIPADGLARFHKMRWNALLGAGADPPEWLVRHFEPRNYSFARGCLC